VVIIEIPGEALVANRGAEVLISFAPGLELDLW